MLGDARFEALARGEALSLTFSAVGEANPASGLPYAEHCFRARLRRTRWLYARLGCCLHQLLRSNTPSWRAVGYLGLRQRARAREKLEQALALAERQANDPTLLATVRLFLARTLWEMGADRPRARVLAENAREGLAKLGRRGDRAARTAAELTAAMK